AAGAADSAVSIAAEHARDLLPQVLQVQSNIAVAQGDIEMARATYDKALQAAIAEFSDAHPSTAGVRHDMGQLMVELGEFDRARPLLTAALTGWTSVYGTDHMDVGRAHLTLANLEHIVGDLERAYHHAESGQDIYDRVLEPDHVDRAAPHTQLGIIEFRRKNFAEAAAAFTAAYELIRRHHGDDHLQAGVAALNLGETLIQLDRVDEALAMLDRAERILDTAGIDVGAWLHKSRGQAMLLTGQPRRAVELLEQAVAAFEATPGYPLERADALWALARAIERSTGRSTEHARELAERARALYHERGARRDSAAIDRWLSGHTGANRAKSQGF
ncbi:MAG: tetratricopeptide repeat protein, partial [Myxococcota bacterium]